MKKYTDLIRPKQWVKNIFIFFPAFFAQALIEQTILFELILGFIAFSASASAVYVLNDWFDAPVDKLHPDKQNRPIAAGLIRKNEIFLLIIGFLSLGFIISLIIDVRFTMMIMIYFGINLVYSSGLKNFPVLDVIIIAFGFLIRVLAGGEIAHVPISKWMLLVTFFLSMFLALAKRRSDLILFDQTGAEVRKVIKFYNHKLINTGLFICAVITFIAYVFYTLSDSVKARIDENLYLTSFFVFLGIARYFYLTFKLNLSGKPTETLYKDLILQIIILLWIALFAWFIYA